MEIERLASFNISFSTSISAHNRNEVKTSKRESVLSVEFLSTRFSIASKVALEMNKPCIFGNPKTMLHNLSQCNLPPLFMSQLVLHYSV